MHKAGKKVRIGVSVVSLLPYSIGPGGIRRALQIANKAGLDGLQLVPLRGWSDADMEEITPSRVLSYEGKWGDVNEKDTLLSWTLFGSWWAAGHKVVMFSCHFPAALAIDQGGDSIVETSPKNLQDEEGYLTRKYGVVLDTWHVMESPRITRDEFRFVEKLVANDSIRLIHFQMRDHLQYSDFLRGEETLGSELLKEAMKSGADIIIELPPQWLLPLPVAKLVAVRNRIRAIEDEL